MSEQIKDGFIRVDDHLYKWQHRAKSGEWSTVYYAVFTDRLHRKPRRMSLETDELETARKALKNKLELNAGHFDFDAIERQRKEKQREADAQANEGLTLKEWGEAYFRGGVHYKAEKLKRESTKKLERIEFDRLCKFFGNVPLADITTGMCHDYVADRTADKLAGGREVCFATANRNLGFLRFLLNRAKAYRKIAEVPIIEQQSEKGRERKRTVSEWEYEAQLSAMTKPIPRRILTFLWEGAFRHHEPMNLTWTMVNMKTGIIVLPPDAIKEGRGVRDRRVVITWSIRQVLDEIFRERRVVPIQRDGDDWVFRRKNGRRVVSFRGAFDLAADGANIAEFDEQYGEPFTPHCYRRAAITRWTKIGIPDAIVRRCSGHANRDVHEAYIQFEDRELVEAFEKAGLLSPPPAKLNVAVEERTAANAG